MRTLLLTVDYPSRASYYDDWRDAFLDCAACDVTVRNIVHGTERRQVAREAGAFDLIVVLHSCTADSLSYAAPIAGTLQARRGRLVCFVGNELNLPWAPLGDKIAWLKSVAPDIIATQLLQEAGAWLYAEVGARVMELPHALNPRVFLPRTPQAERRIDVGARSYRYLAYLGDNDRNRIYDYFAANPFEPPLMLDFSTEQRFDRAGWAQFLNRCKSTISTEAGSWYLERDDAAVLAIRDHVGKSSGRMIIRADSWLHGLAHRLPYGVKATLRRALRGGLVTHEALSAEELDFAKTHEAFFAGRSKAPVYGKCISSRHFDAIGCKTLQIMFPGRYNDILRAGEHYVALNADFSNIDEVLETLRSEPSRRRVVDRAYEHAMSAHTYAHRLAALAAALEHDAAGGGVVGSSR